MSYEEELKAVEDLLTKGPLDGRSLRTKLNKGRWFWQKWSVPGFYNFMAKLEDAGIVKHYKERRTLKFLDPPDDLDTTRRVYSLKTTPCVN